MLRLTFVVGLVLVATAAAAQVVSWFPLAEVRRHAYLDHDGSVLPRFMWHYVEGDGHCILILRDEATGQFAIAPLPGRCPR